jgi:hypothetical protein
MKDIFTQSLFITKSLIVAKSTLLLFLFTLLGLAIASLFIQTDIGENGRFFSDILLSFESILMHLSALLYAYELRQKEHRGHYLLLLIKNSSRLNYSKQLFFATFMINISLFILFLLLNTIFTLLSTHSVDLLYPLLMHFLSASLLAFLLLTISQKIALINAFFYTLMLFFLGSTLDELLLYSYSQSELFQNFSTLIYYIFLNFSLFDNASLNAVNNWQILLYYFVYSTILFLISYSLFKNRVIQLEN